MGRLTRSQIAVIANDYHEKGWTAYRIWQEHPGFGCSRNAIEKQVRKFKETGSEERRPGSIRFTKHHLPRLAFQDEKDFTLQVKANRRNNRVYSRGLKGDIAPSRLFHEGNKFTRKLMVSAVITWKGVSKPFFVAEKNIKVNGENYLRHVKKDLMPFLDSLYPRNDFHFIQDSAPSHRYSEVQEFLTKKLKNRFVKDTEWAPSSPDCNPLDYFFWNQVSEKVYEGRHCNPFKDEAELRKRILDVWPECTSNLKPLRKAIKQFLLRLREVEQKDGYSIKTVFG